MPAVAPEPREELSGVDVGLGGVLVDSVDVGDELLVEEEVDVADDVVAVRELEYAAKSCSGSGAKKALSVGVPHVARPSAPTPQQCHCSSLER